MVEEWGEVCVEGDLSVEEMAVQLRDEDEEGANLACPTGRL